MAEREVKQWITVNGKRVPIFEGQSKADAVKNSLNKDEDTKKKQIAKNKAQADERNGKSTLSDKQKKVADQYLKNVTWKKAVDGEESAEISENHFSHAGISNDKMIKILNAHDSKHEYRIEHTSEKKKSYGMNITVNHHYIVRDKK